MLGCTFLCLSKNSLQRLLSTSSRRVLQFRNQLESARGLCFYCESTLLNCCCGSPPRSKGCLRRFDSSMRKSEDASEDFAFELFVIRLAGDTERYGYRSESFLCTFQIIQSNPLIPHVMLAYLWTNLLILHLQPVSLPRLLVS
ncbi:hypothetical protein KC19_11G012200 [Ceratodon purpureus]|uniref:Uncharacterized protein n=1 Tax=Ceratodon purpureus TaxID=3225 RepID=A0A8T0GFF4_CERPU|nr:hypothetical protein KC19_11G012200 [Ceratodon purpureus]